MSDCAFAQVPGPLVPGRQEEKKSPSLPTHASAPIIPRPNAQAPPPNSADITFLLESLNVEGAKAIPPAQLQDLWKGYLGKTISVATLYEIANDITQTYVDYGYALSFAFVPEQEIEGGHVTLRVVEGFVDEIVVTGNAGQDQNSWPDGRDAQKRVLDMMQRIKGSRPLRTVDLERYLLLINERPGLRAEATFAASTKTAAASKLLINLAYRPLGAQLSTDNRMSGTLGHWTYGGSAVLNGGVTGSDQLRATWRCGVFCNVYSSMAVSWTTYIGAEGAQVGINISHSSEKPENGVLVPLDFTGSDTQLVLQASYPIIRSRQKSLDVGASFNWSDSRTDIFSGPLTEDHVRTLDLYGSFSFTDKTNANTLLRADIIQGLPVFNATDDSDARKSRAGGHADFTNLKVSAVRSQPLATLTPKLNGFSLYTSAQAQLALTAPLLSVSQCFYGGGDIGRGYDSGAISGDSCLMGLIEIRRDFLINNYGLQAYAFGDAGIVSRRGSLPVGEERSSGAQSAGIGLRVSSVKNLQADLQLAVPLRETFTSNGKDTLRAFFSLSWLY